MARSDDPLRTIYRPTEVVRREPGRAAAALGSLAVAALGVIVGGTAGVVLIVAGIAGWWLLWTLATWRALRWARAEAELRRPRERR